MNIMDIEKLKKVNQLATTLRQQGLAAGRDDAAKIAGEMNFSQDDEGLNKIMDTMSPGSEEIVINDAQAAPAQEAPAAPASQPAPTQGTPAVSVPQAAPVQQVQGVTEEKFLSVLQDFADQFSAEVNKITQRVSRQEEMITNIQKALEVLANATPSQQSAPQSSPAPAQQERQETINVKEEEKKTPPRSGNYDSDDVSIEDFFYYGQK